MGLGDMYDHDRCDDRGAIRADMDDHRRKDAVGEEPDPQKHETSKKRTRDRHKHGDGGSGEAGDVSADRIGPYHIEYRQIGRASCRERV